MARLTHRRVTPHNKTKKFMKLKNKGTNETEIHFKNGNVFFFSYDTPVAACIDSRYYKTSEYHSRTTTRHMNRFLDGRVHVEVPQFFFDWMRLDMIKPTEEMT